MIDEKIELQIVALSKSISSPENFVVILENASFQRKIPIIIGHAEAQFIGIVLEKLKTKRPLTHDLLSNFIRKLNCQLSYVEIKDKIDEIFYADIILQSSTNENIIIDARVSDAIALAIKNEVPIYISKNLLEQVGKDATIYTSSNKSSFQDYSLEELRGLLQKLIQKEDYESASRIQEVINKFKSA